MKISCADEGLGNDARGHDGPVALDQLSVGLVAKEKLRQRCDHQGIDQAQQDGGDDCHQYGNQEILFHGVSLCLTSFDFLSLLNLKSEI